jgi:hypothetical protein
MGIIVVTPSRIKARNKQEFRSQAVIAASLSTKFNPLLKLDGTCKIFL